MPRKHSSTEQIVTKRRQAEVELGGACGRRRSVRRSASRNRLTTAGGKSTGAFGDKVPGMKGNRPAQNGVGDRIKAQRAGPSGRGIARVPPEARTLKSVSSSGQLLTLGMQVLFTSWAQEVLRSAASIEPSPRRRCRADTSIARPAWDDVDNRQWPLAPTGCTRGTRALSRGCCFLRIPDSIESPDRLPAAPPPALRSARAPAPTGADSDTDRSPSAHPA